MSVNDKMMIINDLDHVPLDLMSSNGRYKLHFLIAEDVREGVFLDTGRLIPREAVAEIDTEYMTRDLRAVIFKAMKVSESLVVDPSKKSTKDIVLVTWGKPVRKWELRNYKVVVAVTDGNSEVEPTEMFEDLVVFTDDILRIWNYDYEFVALQAAREE